MNLFALNSLNKFQERTQFRALSTIKKAFSICLLTFIASQNAHAFDLQINTLDNYDVVTVKSKDWNYRDLVNGNLIKKLPTLLVINTIDAAYMVEAIKDKYLTFYSNKNEKLNATFDSGAYVIKYTHRW